MLILPKESELHFEFCGFFEAPSAEWVHMSRELREYELMIVTEGTLYIASEDTPSDIKEYEVPAGNYLLMPATKHQYGTHPSSCKFYWFHFEHRRKESGFPLPYQGSCADMARLLPLIASLQDANRTHHNETLNGALFRALLLELSLQQPTSSTQTKNHYAKLCEDIKNYIEWNYFSNIKVADIAAYFGYHEKYISTLFHKETGCKLKEYIQKSKMKHACQALSQTDISIAQLALNLGFSDAHNFSNAFRKIVGCSPSAYRQHP